MQVTHFGADAVEVADAVVVAVRKTAGIDFTKTRRAATTDGLQHRLL